MLQASWTVFLPWSLTKGENTPDYCGGMLLWEQTDFNQINRNFIEFQDLSKGYRMSTNAQCINNLYKFTKLKECFRIFAWSHIKTTFILPFIRVFSTLMIGFYHQKRGINCSECRARLWRWSGCWSTSSVKTGWGSWGYLA